MAITDYAKLRDRIAVVKEKEKLNGWISDKAEHQAVAKPLHGVTAAYTKAQKDGSAYTVDGGQRL